MKPLLTALMAIGLLVGCSDDDGTPGNPPGEKSITQLSREFSGKVKQLDNEKLSVAERSKIRKDADHTVAILEKRVAQESRSLHSGKKHDQFVADIESMKKAIADANDDNELDDLAGRIDGLPAIAEASFLKEEAKEGVRAAGEVAEEAGEKVKEGAKKAADKTREAAHDAAEATENAAERVKEDVQATPPAVEPPPASNP